MKWYSSIPAVLLLVVCWFVIESFVAIALGDWVVNAVYGILIGIVIAWFIFMLVWMK
jgi:hypothetical protein